MPKKVLIILTDGFEEIEAVTPIDILRRAGLEVLVAGLEKKEVKGSHGLQVTAEFLLKDLTELPEAVILPGGPGAETLGASDAVKKWIEKMRSADKTVAAICAAPAAVLAKNGFLKGRNATSFPGYEKEMNAGGALFSTERVVTDGLFVTSRGAGTTMEFSLELAKRLAGEAAAVKVARQILAKD